MNRARGKSLPTNVPSRAPQPNTRRTISLPILVATIVTLLVMLPALYLWRSQQVERGANVYLERAESLAQEESWAQSADYLYLYLRLRPDDNAARMKLAQTVDRAAGQRPQILRAIELYYQALANAQPDEQGPLRQRVAELHLQTEQFALALDEAEKLLQANDQDAKANRVRALALHGLASGGGLDLERYSASDVGVQLEKAVALLPSDVALVTTYAQVLRQNPEMQSAAIRALTDAERAEIAENCFERLVAAAPREASAYLARYQDRARPGQQASEEAAADLRMALELAPDNPVVLMTAANHETQMAGISGSEDRAKHLLAAEEYYARVLRAEPTLDRGYIGLGEVHQLRGRPDLAWQTWQQGLEKCGLENIALNALLADQYITQRQFELAEQCIKRLKLTAESLRRRGLLESQLTFARGTQLIEARLKLTQGKTEDGRTILRDLGKGPKGDNSEGGVTFQALMLLASSYASQDPQLAAAEYAEAAAAQPAAVEPHLATAVLWLSTGNPERAVTSLEKVVSLAGSLENQILLLGAMFQSQLKLAVAERNWEPFEAKLATAKQSVSQTAANSGLWRLGILEAEYRSRRDNSEKGLQAARKVLLATEKAMPPSPDSLVGLSEAYARYEFHDDEDRVLDQLRVKFSSSTSAVLATARSLARRGQIDQARTTVSDGITKASPEQQLPLRLALVGLLAEGGQDAEAWQLLSDLHREQPQDRGILEQLMELSLSTGRAAEAEALEEVFAKLPTVSETDVRYYRARRLLTAVPASLASLQEVEQISDAIQKEMPQSPAGYVLEAQLLERKGLLERAVDAYKQAMQRGERQLGSVERLIALLNQLGRFAESNAYLATLQGAAPNVSELSTLEIATALGSGQTETALKLARQRVAKSPQDLLALIWLGQVQMARSEYEQAEQTLARAVELAPRDPRSQGAMLSCLVRTGQKERARELLNTFVEHLDASPVEKALVLAAGLESMGAADESLVQLRQAEELDPSNAKVHERIGVTLLQQDPVAAEKSLRRALELDSNMETARRALAAVLADRGGQENWQAAVKLLGESQAADASLLSTQRMHAMMLARRGGAENLAKARSILENLSGEGNSPSVADRFLLAQLTEIEGNTDRAGEQLLALASEQSPQPVHVAAYVDWLLRQERADEAAVWLERLQQLGAKGIENVGLQVRWLLAMGRTDQIEPAIEKFAQQSLTAKASSEKITDADKLYVSRASGDLYMSAGQPAAAERWYRRAFGLDPKEYGRLASSVAKLGRVADAVEICRIASESDESHLPALTLAEVLVASELSTVDLTAAESIFADAVARHADNPDLLVAIANLRIIQSRYDDGIKLYRRVIKLKPDSVNALNNLAAILADRPDQMAEAISLLDRAIQFAGPQPNLLDTKGTILLSLNRVDEALPLLIEAASSPSPDPRYLFHLAVAHYRAGELSSARKSFEDAQRRKLEGTVLTQSDTEMLAELNEKLR